VDGTTMFMQRPFVWLLQNIVTTYATIYTWECNFGALLQFLW